MLLKGVNKRVIVIKNPESEIFEEAYFIIRSNNIKGVFKQSKSNENEMLIEANRIISDYHNQQRSIIEKNGIASGTNIIGSDLSELDKLDNFLTGGAKNKKIAESEDETFFESMWSDTEKTEKIDKAEKYGNLMHYDEQPRESAFKFVSSKKISKLNKLKKIRLRNIPAPPRSFFVGVGFMSAVIILIKLFELIVLG